MLSWINSELVSVERIGRGGMAEVFRGYQLGPQGFRRPVAIKRILPAFSQSKRHAAQFIEEARLHGRLQHNNIVQIVSCLQQHDDLLLVMELVEGRSLSDLSEQLGKSDTIERCLLAASVGRDIASALDHAHALFDPTTGKSLGLVHRDVTPRNIMLTHDGSAKLLDFGIAKTLSQIDLTRSTEIKGTVCYLSPEYLADGELDHRCDLFSLGVVLWEMVANRKLFEADTPLKALIKVKMTYIPRFEKLNLDVPPELEDVIRKLLSQNPDDRYQSADEVVVALSETLKKICPYEPRAICRTFMHMNFGEDRQKSLKRDAEALKSIERAVRFWLPVKNSISQLAKILDPRRPLFPGSQIFLGAVLTLLVGIMLSRLLRDKVEASELLLKRPPFFNQLVAWYSADSVGTGESTPVRIWRDHSSRHFEAIQDNPSFQPKLQWTADHKFPILHFGGKQFLTVPGIPAAMRSKKELSVVVVGRVKGKSAGYFWALQEQHTSVDVARLGGYMGNRILIKTKPIPNQDYSYSAPIVIDKFAIITFSMDTKAARVFMNGSEILDAPLTEPVQFMKSSSFAIGQELDEDDPSDFLNGDIAQIMVFDHALKQPDRLEIENYLSRKYEGLIGQ